MANRRISLALAKNKLGLGARPRPSEWTEMDISVQCRADHVGEDIPYRLIIDGREIEIADVIDRWLAIDHRYFKVQTLNGSVYIVRHDEPSRRWELIMFDAVPRVRSTRDMIH